MKKQKEYIIKTFRLEAGVAKRLEEYAGRSGRTMTWVLEQAASQWLDQAEKAEGGVRV